MDSYSLADVLNPRDTLYGGRCETYSLHDQSTDRSVIKYVDVQSLYPYACKSKHYPIGHPRCLMGPNLRVLDVNSYEILIKCKVLPPRGLRISLLSCHINCNVMFLLCQTYAETTNYFERLEDRALYCDTDSIIYRYVEGMYNPPLSEFVGGMTDELRESYITEYVSNGPKNYAYRTGDGKQVVKIKGFTLNCVASQQLTVDVMKERWQFQSKKNTLL